MRRHRPMPYGTATSFHPGGVLVHRSAFSAVVLRRNRLAGAIWLDPDGLWRAAPVGSAALAVSGDDPDEDALVGLEGWAPAFRHFAEARERLLADLSDGGGTAAPAAPGPGGRGGGGPGRGGERRGEVISLAARRRGGARRG